MRRAAAIGPLVTTFGSLAVTACASIPLPNDAFQAADTAIASADQDKASEFAPAELSSARTKMAAARAAVANDPGEEDVVHARLLADEATADAQLASARARDSRAEVVNSELLKNNDTLRHELQRGPGGGS